ncbi:MAG: SDR family oxidoreductase [Actinomycetia bacterium]|nr:SDR family oxidoreductase [Actinomycetes bacterium]
MVSFSLEGKVAVLTGASSGLGHRFAHCLGEAGAAVVLAARRADRIDPLAAALPEATAVPCDLTAPGAPAGLLAASLDAYGQVDVIVNNAGISRVLPAIEDDLDGFRYELEINLVAPYELARLSARWMLDEGRPGSIINIGSVLGNGGGGRLKVPGYAASKGGLHNLTRELASQWARKGVRVNGIAPGWFETEMNVDMFGTDGGMSYITDNTPMGRPGREGELDGALLFLASEASTYVTGQVLFVDGGWTAI